MWCSGAVACDVTRQEETAQNSAIAEPSTTYTHIRTHTHTILHHVVSSRTVVCAAVRWNVLCCPDSCDAVSRSDVMCNVVLLCGISSHLTCGAASRLIVYRAASSHLTSFLCGVVCMMTREYTISHSHITQCSVSTHIGSRCALSRYIVSYSVCVISSYVV